MTTTTTKNSVKGHALKADGAAFTQDGERLFPGKTGGWGHGLCECGIICAETDTRKARVEWHRKHKAKAAREASAPAPAKASAKATSSPAKATSSPVKGHALKDNGAAFDGEYARVEEGTTKGRGAALCECGVRSSLNFGSRKARVDWHQIHRARFETPAEAPADTDTFQKEVPYRAAAKHFWPSLGRDGAFIIIGHEFENVTISHVTGAEDRTLTLEGPDKKELKAAAARLVEVWTEADGDEFILYKRNDPTYLELGQTTKDNTFQRKERLLLEGEFFLSYCLSVVEA